MAAIVRQLEQELKPPARQPATNAMLHPNLSATSGKSARTNAAKAVAPLEAKKSPSELVTKTAADTSTAAVPGSPSPKGLPARYAYQSPHPPTPGNRSEAGLSFARAAQAYKERRLPEALQAYRLVVAQDPSLFQAQYNLGLAAFEAGDLPLALTSYENALAIQPASFEARYNFALALKQANYPSDAVNELEKALTAYPNEVGAHLALGNIYAQQLSQPAKARQHYLKVLELEPQHPQAGAIRQWLAAHPA